MIIRTIAVGSRIEWSVFIMLSVSLFEFEGIGAWCSIRKVSSDLPCGSAANPAGFPAGPEGETPLLSERDLVVAVDQLGVFILGRLRTA